MISDEGYGSNLLNRLFKNSFFLVTSRISDIGVAIIITPFIARYLGLKAFGDYALVTAISIFIKPLVEFGSEAIICRDVARDKENSSVYINSSLLIRGILSICLFLLLYLLVELIFSDREIKIAILFSTVAEIIISFTTIFFAVIRAHERMEYELISNLIHKAIFFAGIVMVIVYDSGFLSIFYIRLFSSLLFLLFALFFVYSRLVIFTQGFSNNIIVSILKDGFPLVLVALLATASSKIDIFFLKYFKGSAEVALFDIPNRLIIQLQFIPFSIITALFPFFTQMSIKPHSSFKGHYESVLKFLYIGSIFSVMVMSIWAEVIISSIFGEQFVTAALSLKIIAWILIFFSLNFFLQQILIILGKQKVFSIFAFVSFATNVILDILLIPYYGYIGASIATLVSCFVLFVLTILYVTAMKGRMNITEIFAKPSLCILLTWIGCYFANNKGIISFIIFGSLGLVIYIFLLIIMKTFSKDELEIFRNFIVKRQKLAEGIK